MMLAQRAISSSLSDTGLVSNNAAMLAVKKASRMLTLPTLISLPRRFGYQTCHSRTYSVSELVGQDEA
jgi:hypothetical protein